MGQWLGRYLKKLCVIGICQLCVFHMCQCYTDATNLAYLQLEFYLKCRTSLKVGFTIINQSSTVHDLSS